MNAWAVVVENTGEIFLHTVRDTRRAAIVNWLVSNARVGVLTHHTDDDIEQMWHEHSAGLLCTTVIVS